MSPLYHRKLPNQKGAVLLRFHRPHASTQKAEGNQAITVLAGVSGAFAPDVAMIMTSALELPSRRAVCPHRTSADVMAITEWSIAFARPNLADSRRSPTALPAHTCPALIRMLRLRP